MLFALLIGGAQTGSAQTDRHTVSAGETLYSIARRYDTSVAALQQQNGLRGNTIRVGQQLVVPSRAGVGGESHPAVPGLPPGFRLHTVARGESMNDVAVRYGLTLKQVLAVNPEIEGIWQIDIGTELRVPPRPGVLTRLLPDQSLLALALEYDASPGDIVRANGLERLSEARPAQLLFIPTDQIPTQQTATAATTENEAELFATTAPLRDQHLVAQQQLLGRSATLLASFRYEPEQQGYLWPLTVRGQITSRFGRRNISVGGNTFHGGLDIAAPTGTPIVSSRSGVVSRSGWIGAYGYAVYVDHGDGTQTRYAHMSQISVRSGQRVERGQQLGLVGSTGASTGPHLHFEIRNNGYATDPLGYLLP
ncbi:MAG: LysM peptidoglycan-binding domain-containing M23 family metallopeptidase [Trueperaceae bacterium]|nr:LysM peptidoglycan-binding domain-containing M23 family metallopeptidase [Trueperaceae bacterium]